MISTTVSDPDMMKIVYVLALTSSFMFAELIYGYLSNSLGLISDAFHMLCDSFAMAVGLVAAYLAKRQ